MVEVAQADRAGGDRVASSAVAVQAWFEDGETEIRPGETRRLVLTIENLGERTESLTILPAGTTAAWTTVSKPNLTLFAQSHDTVEIVVRPPAVHTTSAGATTLAVRIVPLVDPDDTVMSETTLLVQPFDDRRLSLLQPLQRARRRALFEFMVENHGNTLASCRLRLIDPSNRVDGNFDPPAVGVAPGGSSLVRLRLHSTSVMFRRRDRQLDFEIEATQTDHDPAVARGSLVQPPTIPPRLMSQVAALTVVVLLAVAAWFGVVRPELREAARQAVDDRVADLATASAVGGDAVDTDTTSISDGASGDASGGSGDIAATTGEQFTVRLPLRISVGGTNSDSAVVPEGARLLLTDVVLQNPGADLGTAALLRNSDVIYEWDLGGMNSANEFQPRLTPLPFEPGDEIVFRSSCESTGDPSSTGCAVAVLLAGLLVERD
jgi:hypothetical protein